MNDHSSCQTWCLKQLPFLCGTNDQGPLLDVLCIPAVHWSARLPSPSCRLGLICVIEYSYMKEIGYTVVFTVWLIQQVSLKTPKENILHFNEFCLCVIKVYFFTKVLFAEEEMMFCDPVI